MKHFVYLFFILSCSCSTLQSSKGSEGAPQKVRIELKGNPGASIETRYHSHTNVKNYSDRQLLRDKNEVVDFTTVTRVQGYDPQGKILTYSVKTVAKDGAADLHDMAFPEKSEEIDYIVRADGTVLRAGTYPPQGLFFVPSLPVPQDEVEVGDTWSMTHTWYSSHDGIPLKLDIAAILKGIVPCEAKGKFCADIEISGGVKLATLPTTEGARFNNRVWGRLLYSLERGDVLWSEMRSLEEMVVKGERTSVLSCMVSEAKQSDKYKTRINCDPAIVSVTAVPRI